MGRLETARWDAVLNQRVPAVTELRSFEVARYTGAKNAVQAATLLNAQYARTRAGTCSSRPPRLSRRKPKPRPNPRSEDRASRGGVKIGRCWARSDSGERSSVGERNQQVQKKLRSIMIYPVNRLFGPHCFALYPDDPGTQTTASPLKRLWYRIYWQLIRQ
jgi:hypothetical protein